MTNEKIVANNPNVRFAGAQIPCTDNLETNINHIKAAISWAGQNKVDYLLTPEGSLSGYFPDWDTRDGRTINDIYAAERQVVNYAVENNVGLCLGTMWGETDPAFLPEGYRKENQIRFYTNTGELAGTSSKMYILPKYDQCFPAQEVNKIDLPNPIQNFYATGLICNDFWGGPLTNNISLPLYAHEILRTHVVFHATNGFRGMLPVYDEVMEAWHNANLQVLSWTCIGTPIITVDNSINMNGTAHHGKTSSQSGILLNGEWKVKAERIGTQYFYYDFDVLSLVNYQLTDRPDDEIIKANPGITFS